MGGVFEVPAGKTKLADRLICNVLLVRLEMVVGRTADPWRYGRGRAVAPMPPCSCAAQTRTSLAGIYEHHSVLVRAEQSHANRRPDEQSALDRLFIRHAVKIA